MKPKVTLAAPGNLPQIVSLALQANIGADEEDLTEADLLAQATVGKDVVGCVALDFFDDFVILHSLVVSKSLRKSGIGKLLVDFCTEKSKARKASGVYALTMFWNVNFFRKCGYETMSRRDLPLRLAKHPQIADPALRHSTLLVKHLTHAQRRLFF